jgi:AraC-like DNA-binding protein
MARPQYRPSADEYRQVRCLKAAGWGERDLARLLNISRETLRKHFAADLADARLQCRAEGDRSDLLGRALGREPGGHKGVARDPRPGRRGRAH